MIFDLKIYHLATMKDNHFEKDLHFQRFYHEKIYQIIIKYNKWPYNTPIGGHKIYQHLPLQDPPKFTQIGFFFKYTILQPWCAGADFMKPFLPKFSEKYTENKTHSLKLQLPT
jgi:hypothetical protein